MKPVPREALRRISRLCARRWDRHYSLAKMRTDPAYAAVCAELDCTTLPLLDIGCGIGLLAFYLREAGFTAPITGIDYDVRKIRSANQITQSGAYSDLHFSQGDARAELPSFTGSVVILDMLQWFTCEEQDRLLQQAAARLAPGGRLIIRTGLADGSLRWRVTVLGDYMAHWTFWIKKAPVCYPDAVRLKARLREAGLTVTSTPMWGRTPFNNYLITGGRPAAESP